MKYAITFLMLFLFSCRSIGDGSSNVASDDTNTSPCLKSWQNWLQTFAGSSPIISANKTQQWKIEREQMEKSLKGDFKIRFLDSPKLDGKAYENYDASLLKTANESSPRNDFMYASISDLKRTNQKDNLLIVVAGLAHVLDYFYQSLDKSIYYGSFPLRADSEFETPELYEFFRLMGDRKEEVRGDYQSLVTVLAFYSKLNLYLKRGVKVTTDDMYDNPLATNASTLLIADNHTIRDYSLVDGLPKRECLKELGFTSITVAIETGKLKAKMFYNHDEVYAKFDVVSQIDKKKVKSIWWTSSKAYNLLVSGKVQTNPNIIHLLNYLKDLEDNNVKVNYTGLEK